MTPQRSAIETVFQHGPYRIRKGGPQDRDGILTTFNATFPDAVAEFRPRARAEWDWAFRDNPAGDDFWVAETDDGRIVAQFAGLPIRVLHAGETLRFSQIVDSFTHPEHRRGLKRPGIFVATALSYIDAMVWADRTAVAYGFPMPEPLRLGRRAIGYETVRTMTYLSLGAEHGVSGGAPDGLEVEEIAHVPAGVRALFDACIEATDMMGVRDADWIAWRYLTHPRERYRIGIVRDGTGLRGLVVYRNGEFGTLSQGLVMEWLVPKDDDAAARALLAWTLAQARDGGPGRVGVLLAECDPWWLGLQRLGMKVHWSPHTLIYGVWSRDDRFDDLRLRRHWRYTFGETDFA